MDKLLPVIAVVGANAGLQAYYFLGASSQNATLWGAAYAALCYFTVKGSINILPPSIKKHLGELTELGVFVAAIGLGISMAIGFGIEYFTGMQPGWLLFGIVMFGPTILGSLL